MSRFEKITSKDNEVIKLASQLVSGAKFRRQHRMFVLDGLRLCRDAAGNSFPVECLIVGETAYDKNTAKAELLSQSASRSCIVPDRLIAKISDTVNPQGFLCICSMKEDEESLTLKRDGRYIGLENLSDPSNLGAVSRTAEAFAFDGIIVSKNGCDPYSPKALRASMGALLRIPVIEVGDFAEFVKNTELKTYAAVVDKTAESIRSVDFGRGCIALIGNEANGLTADTSAACDKRITIPMEGKAESLNAATAAAIVMWEMCGRV